MDSISVPEWLRCEYVEDPIGVNTQHPVLSWNARGKKRGSVQRAYRIVASTSLVNLKEEIYDKWDSGKVESRDNCFVTYQGIELHSAERIFWQVTIWDETGYSPGWSKPAFFEMGLLKRSDWKGRWMSFLGGMHGNGILLRRKFTLEKKPVRARANICGIGYYELRLNGEKIGDKLLDPGATDYSKTLLYSIYDVTERLGKGDNVVGIILGNGWAGSPKAILQLNIDYADGTREEIVTDWGKGWDVARGPIIYNSIYDGEDYDAREEKDGWDTPTYNMDAVWQRPGGWILATIVEDPGGELVPEISEPVRSMERIKPKLDHVLPDGSRVYDVGINLTGYAEIQVKGEAGSKVVMKFAEVLDKTGDLDTANLRLARCQDSYILRGKADGEKYAPRFTYHGFRFMRLRTEAKVEVDDITIHFLRSDLAKNASFRCSDDFLNRLEQVMWHTEACNMFSVPTDCCQRDERHGWTQDTVVRLEGSTYHFDVSAFYEKWLRDIFDTQDDAGYIADSAPHRWGNRPCDPMVNTPIKLPLLLYRTYGNRRVLEKYYANMQKFIQALLSEADGFIVSRYGYGEWACPAAECIPEPNGPGAVARNVSPALVCTAYLFLDITQMKEISILLGKDKDTAYYHELAQKVKNAFNKSFLNQQTFQYDKGTQSANTIALAYGLVPEECADRVVENIGADIVKRDYHLSTGSQATKLIFEVLSQYGREDMACAVMQQRTSPSFGYMLEHGATSMWERWEADRNNNIMNSRNQSMFATCCTWFYKCLGGIQPNVDARGFDRILISPVIPNQLEFSETELGIISGRVRVSWRKVEQGLKVDVDIPFNTQAEITIPLKGCTASAPLLYEGGIPISGSQRTEGIIHWKKMKDRYIVSTGSGSYHFLVK
jgi:alpha-L-rhamnosidase